MTAIPSSPSVSSEPNDHCSAMPVASKDCPRCGHTHLLGWKEDAFICAYCAFGLALENAAPPATDANAEPVDVPAFAFQLGNYLVLEEIGRGTMGVIYRAMNRATREIVAIKTVIPEDTGTPEILERFSREALAARSLDHPYSMPIYEVGCSEIGIPYFSMALAEGGSLHELGSKYRGRWQQIAELMVKIAAAIHQAHELGLIHRDLKPGNILFTRDHEPLVTDYGLVKDLANAYHLTHSHAMLGTPSYTAPEQAAGKTRDVTASADIYSLGAILFELLTGRPPFVGDNVLDLLQQVTRRPPVRPRSLAPLVPKGLDIICIRCLERDPSDRYASARDFADDLKCWLKGEQISSPPFRTRISRKIRRYPLLHHWQVRLACVVLVLGIASVVAMSGRPLVPMTAIAVTVDDLDQGMSIHEVANRLTVGLKTELSKRRSFKLLGDLPTTETSSASVLDPLAYGRMKNAQFVLSATVRDRPPQLQITSRLLRCDTGVAVWLKTDLISSARSATELKMLAASLIAAIEQRAITGFSMPRTPRPEALAFYDKAMVLTVHGNPQDMKAAIGLFARACNCEPHYVQARAMLGLALLTQATRYGETNLLASALAITEEALREGPNSPQAHRVAGACYFRQHRYEEALSELWRGVELDPQAPGCVQALGVCLREMGKPEQALPWLKRASQLAPSRGVFAMSFGETLALCARDDDADKALRHAAELDQDQPDALIAISALRTWQRAFPEARRLCDDVRQRFPESRNAAAVSAWISLCDGNYKDAKAKYEVLRNKHFYETTSECYGAVNPSSALAYFAKQENLLLESRSLAEEAIVTDQDLLRQNPNDSRLLYDLAATFAVAGDLLSAQKYMDKALSAGWVERRSTELDPRLVPITRIIRPQTAVTYVPNSVAPVTAN